jgi:hypothetical protein
VGQAASGGEFILANRQNLSRRIRRQPLTNFNFALVRFAHLRPANAPLLTARRGSIGKVLAAGASQVHQKAEGKSENLMAQAPSDRFGDSELNADDRSPPTSALIRLDMT